MPQLVLQPDGPAGIDTTLVSTGPGTNFGTGQSSIIGLLVIGKAQAKYRFLLQFDISAIPAGSTITGTSLVLKRFTSSGLSNTPFTANRITQPAWEELAATWLNYASALPWAQAGGDFTASGQSSASINSPDDLVFNDLAMAALAQDAIDNRSGLLELLVKADDETGDAHSIEVFTSDFAAEPNDRPKLTVDYELPLTAPHDRATWTAVEGPLDFTTPAEPLDFTTR